jgi:hypothetical protein
VEKEFDWQIAGCNCSNIFLTGLHVSIRGCCMGKLAPKALIQRERERLESRQARILAMLDDIHQEQQRLEHESQELDVADRVFSRLESESEIKVLPYEPPALRRHRISSETDVLDLSLTAESGVAKLERA